MHKSFALRFLLVLLAQFLFLSSRLSVVQGQAGAEEEPRKVEGYMQPRAGARMKQIEADVHEAPVDPPFLKADQIRLPPKELVLGLVLNGQPWAFPVRFLARFEIVNSRVGKIPVAGTW